MDIDTIVTGIATDTGMDIGILAIDITADDIARTGTTTAIATARIDAITGTRVALERR